MTLGESFAGLREHSISPNDQDHVNENVFIFIVNSPFLLFSYFSFLETGAQPCSHKIIGPV